MIIFKNGVNCYRKIAYRTPYKGEFYLNYKGTVILCASSDLTREEVILEPIDEIIHIKYEPAIYTL